MHNTIHIGLLAGVVMGLNAAVDAASRPNILLILSDDHSKNAISCYGNK